MSPDRTKGLTDVGIRKEALRRQMRSERDAHDPVPTTGSALAQHVMDLPEMMHARSILVCLSFGSEIDTAPLVELMLGRGLEVFVPRAWPDRRLTVHAYPCALETRRFGLRQPKPEVTEITGERTRALDAALVLGLAFDRRGNRLGYGAGYFDRFLARQRFPTIGLAFENQIVEQVPTEPHDIAMTCVVTERGVAV